MDQQSAVVLGEGNTTFAAAFEGTIQRWDLAGNTLPSISLAGWGSVAGENDYPASRGVAAFGSNYLTYSSGILSAWDLTGTRVGQATMDGGGSSFDSNFSYSYAADGRFWVADQAGGTWRGYSIAAVPEPASMAALGFGILALVRKRSKK